MLAHTSALASTVGFTSVSCVAFANLTASDYVEAFAYQNSGDNLDIDHTTFGYVGRFSLFYLGE